MTSDAKRMSLCDLVKIIKPHVQNSIPPTWTTFAVDVAELHVSRGHFVESTDEDRVTMVCVSSPCQLFVAAVLHVPVLHHVELNDSIHLQVFVDTATLERFVGLRLRYLVFIVSSSLSCVPELKVTDCKPDFHAMMHLLNEELNNVNFDIKQASTLVSFDVLLSSDDWADKWSYVLARSSSRQELETCICDQSNITPAGSTSLEDTKNKLTGKSASVQATQQPSSEHADAKADPDEQKSGDQQGNFYAMDSLVVVIVVAISCCYS